MRENRSADQDFQRLVASIYESALDVSAMPAALDLFSRYTLTDSPRYLIWDKLAGHARFGVTAHGCFHDGMRLPHPAATCPADTTTVTDDAHAMAAMLDARLVPQCQGGMSGQAGQDRPDLERGIRLLDTPEVCVLMSATHRHGGELQDRRRDGRLSRVLPHWARAARLQHRHFELSCLASLGLASLDALDFGVMVLQADRRVRYTNRWAESLLQSDARLSMDDGMLTAQDAPLNAALERLLERALRPQGPEASGHAAGSWMHVTSGGQAVPLIVMPLTSRQPVEGSWPLPYAMLLMGNSASRSVLDAAVLATLFGLSRKEGIIAARLAAGETVAEIAARECLSPHTVRVQLRDILRKTGTHRQAELVRLLHLLPGVDLDRAGIARDR
ncbi:helix-turn-helix transcriptional regulator [Cupriavidus respiraculi]|uniref:helix-turn-helix transcriptional regulator n=1 Tax=Cupriavidus respiraculi TaxID=195930 RepID=UPI001C950360|nr:helix-turn-helix transcriptional regulator [Cupriavidus respiraculi]MBY4949592.1 helix-turn-helix transcriptional regulator [Cupriavidus respiraculi]